MTRQQRDKILPTSQGDRAGERLPSTESWTDLAKKYALMTTGAGRGTTLSAYLSLGYWILVIVPVIRSTQGLPFEAASVCRRCLGCCGVARACPSETSLESWWHVLPKLMFQMFEACCSMLLLAGWKVFSSVFCPETPHNIWQRLRSLQT